jgi:hypothetical protein
MQNAPEHLISVIPAQAGIQKSLIFLIGNFWTPAYAGVTGRFASSC